MTDGRILIERDGTTLTLTLNRPDKLNAIDGAMLDALGDALAQIERDRTVRAVIRMGGREDRRARTPASSRSNARGTPRTRSCTSRSPSSDTMTSPRPVNWSLSITRPFNCSWLVPSASGKSAG